MLWHNGSTTFNCWTGQCWMALWVSWVHSLRNLALRAW